MKEIELINKRKLREKHFLREDGTIVAKVYNEDIHYLKNGKYEDIDNTLVKENDCYCNRSNDYKVRFKNNGNDSLMIMEKDDNYLDIKLKESHNVLMKKKKQITPYIDSVSYDNILDGINLEYKALPTKIKETIILNNNECNKIDFVINTNLLLQQENNQILALNEEKAVFSIDAPYMEDKLGQINNNIFYKLTKNNNVEYELELYLDKEWLDSPEREYPVYVDPTISNINQTNSVHDTYISNQEDKFGNNTLLKVGVEKVSNVDIIHRALMKFDLPELGTGSEIINAILSLTSCLRDDFQTESKAQLVSVHRVTTDWSDTTANWNQMNDKYDSRVEALMSVTRSEMYNNELYASMAGADITSLVKKWYRDTPNYGIMLKAVKEYYVDNNFPAFFSNEANNPGDTSPKPIFQIAYRNYNGIESYLDYKKQAFTNGMTCVNTYNGNLTGIFDIGKTIGGSLPASLKLIYNTNDVVLNNQTFFGKGYKLNYEQTIKQVTITEKEYLEYVDEDGTTHYFSKKESLIPFDGTDNNETSDDQTFYDEDGLGLSIEKSNDSYIMTDSENVKSTFTKKNDVYYLTEIKDNDGFTIEIQLNDDNRISKIIDGNNYEINIAYNDNNITISSPDNTNVILEFENGKIKNLKSILGTIVFQYNTHNLISSIVDVTGISINYEYYENSPYKVKKISQYGLNNTTGQYMSFEYGFDTTSVVDNKGRTEILIFNSSGNLISKNSLKSINDISQAYSITESYGENDDNKNKILNSVIPVKYVKNYLSNCSFEENIDKFTSVGGVLKSYSTEFYNTGNRSLKVTSSDVGQRLEQVLSVAKGKYYTFSGYFKNIESFSIKLSYTNLNGQTESSEVIVNSSNDFKRQDITIYYDDEATSDLKISFVFNGTNTVYIDDIQLEEGEVANNFNIIENSDFSNGYSDWTVKAYDENNNEVNSAPFFEVVNINDKQEKALKVKMNPLYTTRFRKTFPIKGKEGDLYTISFWYKNEGVAGCRQYAGNNVTINFIPTDGDIDYCVLASPDFNPNETKWQYFSYRNYALKDYNSVEIIFTQNTEANDFYITNLTFYKNVTSGDYNYDEKGNLISIKDQEDNESQFKYDSNNQLINMTNTMGDDFKYEYSSKNPTQLIAGISSSGVANEIKYDSNGNPIVTRISKKYNLELTNGVYKIRSKGTDKYITAVGVGIIGEANTCSNTVWKLEKVEDKYKIIYSILPDYSLKYENDNLVLSKDNANNLFTIEKTENNTYCFGIKLSDNTHKYLKLDGTKLKIEYRNEIEPEFEFYIENIEDIFIENSSTYSEDNRFITGVTDTNLRKTLYDYDEDTGLLNSKTLPNGQTIYYEYNSKHQLISMSLGDQEVSYTYNSQNLLDTVTHGSKNYKYIYDDFLNIKQIKLGNNIVFETNTYGENNDKLVKTVYGNGNEVAYSYDDFDRIDTIIREDGNYKYKYDNNGNVARKILNGIEQKYKYDTSNRVYEFAEDDFRINYTYNSKNKVTNKTYQMGNVIHNAENIYGDMLLPDKIKLDTDEITYEYDSLGRLVGKNINEKYEILYNYITNGKRTSTLIDTLKNQNNEYRYTYDNMSNIKEIYNNNDLIKKYYYDEYNQLIKEENYDTKKKIEYQYDTFSNILSKKIYNIETGEKDKEILYQYQNNNWSDQLTNYDGVSIVYDTIGNPVNIGENVTMTWMNGRMLKRYQDSSKNLDILYKYNDDGIRISKTVNNVETRYYVENGNVVCEKTGNNIIHYMYDLTGVIGLDYNGDRYYYIKNIQDDVVGILNEDFNQVISYEYDSWGKLISIKDVNGNIVTDKTNIGIINPFRYRSYYYDNETELYYLKQRYYNPEWGRFINSDVLLGVNSDINSYNLYAYTSNNPITFSDESGMGFFGDLFNKAAGFVKKIGDTIVDAMGKLVGIKTTKTKNTKNTSNGKGASVTKTSGVKSEKYYFGSSDSIFQIGYNVEASYDKGGKVLSVSDYFSLEAKFSQLNAELEYGRNHAGLSVGSKIGVNKYSFSTGLDSGRVFIGTDAATDLGADVEVSTGLEASVDDDILIPVAVGVGVFIASPGGSVYAIGQGVGAAISALG